MDKAKKLLRSRPFKPEQEGVYSLARRLYAVLKNEDSKEAARLKQSLWRIIDNEDLSERVQQSRLLIL